MKQIVYTFGRFNPPTKAHGMVIEQIKSLAKDLGCDYHVHPTMTHDKRNPLSYERKLHWMHKAFDFEMRYHTADKIRTLFDLLHSFEKDGYTRVIMIVGSDHVHKFKTILEDYNGTGEFYFPDGCLVICSGERNSDANDMTGVSASRMRAAAHNDDLKTFSLCSPETLSDDDIRMLFEEVKSLNT